MTSNENRSPMVVEAPLYREARYRTRDAVRKDSQAGRIHVDADGFLIHSESGSSVVVGFSDFEIHLRSVDL